MKIQSIGSFAYRLTMDHRLDHCLDHGHVIQSLFRHILGPLCGIYQQTEIIVNARSILSLSDYISTNAQANRGLCCLSYSQGVDMMKQLMDQLTYLQNEWHYAYYGFDMDSVVCIDGTWIFWSTRYLLPMNPKTDTITLLYPPSTMRFTNSTIQSIRQLPATIPARCGYASLANCMVWLLQPSLESNSSSKPDPDPNPDMTVIPFPYSKLYWCLYRCWHHQVPLFI